MQFSVCQKVIKYYVREFYMENILEKKLVSKLLRGFGKNASTTKKNNNKTRSRYEIAKI